MKDVKTSIRMNEAMLDKLKEIAQKKDIPVSQLIREAIKLYISQEDK
jgi:predicted DNA-binding protein